MTLILTILVRGPFGKNLQAASGNEIAAEAFGVEGEVVKEPDKVKDALGRGKRAVAEGRPYLIDIHTWRDGIGTASTWHPPYSIADQRSRKV